MPPTCISLTYAQRRIALEALGAMVTIYRGGSDPRYTIKLDVDLGRAPG